MKPADRWEHGSVFPLMLPHASRPATPPGDWRLYGSGRYALRALLEFGQREYGWQTIHVPAYYCPEVVASLVDLLPVRRYDSGPIGPHVCPNAGPDDVVIAVAYFGQPPLLPATPAMLVIDATHDPVAPWLNQMHCDYVVASLRKTLPLPDGGALWSGTGRPLPPPVPPTAEHLATTSRTLSAMCLKRAYLDGAPLDKKHYLALFGAGEAGLSSAAVSGISDFSRWALGILPAEELRRRRMANAATLATALRDVPGARAQDHPFGLVLTFDTGAQREAVRRDLIAHDVYPAVLWSIDEYSPAWQLEFSRRMLYLHTDIRYDDEDLHRVAEKVHASCLSYLASSTGTTTSSILVVPQPAGRGSSVSSVPPSGP